MDDSVAVQSPLYLLKTVTSCWRCHQAQEVVGLAAHTLIDDGEEVGGITELVMLSNVRQMPSPVLNYVCTHNDRYQRRFVRASGEAYLTNACICGAHFGDFYLFSEPGVAFFPDSVEAAAAITYQKMPFAGTLYFDCD